MVSSILKANKIWGNVFKYGIYQPSYLEGYLVERKFATEETFKNFPYHTNFFKAFTTY
jgi:hypothetical protein